MKSQAEIYQALLDGKIIISAGQEIKLDKDGNQNTIFMTNFEHPEEWSIKEEICN